MLDYQKIYEQAHAEVPAYQNNNMGIRLWDDWSTLPLSDPILEIGCGNGQVCQKLKETGHSVSGLDVAAGPYQRDYPFQLWDVTKIPWPYADGAFGTALAFDLFEHLEKPVQRDVFMELMRVSRNQIVSIPDYGAGDYHVAVFPLHQWESWLKKYVDKNWNLIKVLDRFPAKPQKNLHTGIFARFTMKGTSNGTF